MNTSPCLCDGNFTHIILFAKTTWGFCVSVALMAYNDFSPDHYA